MLGPSRYSVFEEEDTHQMSDQTATRGEPAPRYVGDWPRIGIRPAIDGRRRGVRESLEEQTMGMAQATADLLSANLRYPDGKPVECVIADNCIGGVAESAQAADKFRHVIRSWRDPDQFPKNSVSDFKRSQRN